MKSNRVDKEAMNMEIPKIHESEYRFCLIMWEHEPVTAVELVKLCQDQLGWKGLRLIPLSSVLESVVC